MDCKGGIPALGGNTLVMGRKSVKSTRLGGLAGADLPTLGRFPHLFHRRVANTDQDEPEVSRFACRFPNSAYRSARER